MKIIAIDHGTTSGFCVMNVMDNKVSILNKRFINFTSSTSYADIYEEYEQIISEYERDCLYLVIEKVNMRGASFGYESILRLTEIRALIKLIAEQKGMQVIEVNPKSMKAYITGNGRSDKMCMAKTICDMFKLDIEKHVLKLHTKNPLFDMIDAIGLCYVGASNVIMNKVEKEEMFDRPSGVLKQFKGIEICQGS